jgi:hypothetical protein
MGGYIEAKDVRSPRRLWTLIDVLVDKGENDYAVAIGEWEGERHLAIRWNGNNERPSGQPQSRGDATWFIIPKDLNAALAETLPENKRVLAKALLDLT